MKSSITISKIAGFCFGVKRAIKIIEDLLKTYGTPIYTLGPIIHNNHVVNNLKKQGVIPIKTLANYKKTTIIGRTHGITLEDINIAAKNKINLVDTTCPYIKRTQKYISQLSKEGVHVIIFGNKQHPEVKSLLSYILKNNTTVVETPEKFNLKTKSSVALLSQTTVNQNEFNKLVEIITNQYPKIKTYNTICDAVKNRQNEAIKLSQKHDIVFILGSKNSSNTTKLYQICKDNQPNTYLLESAGDLNYDWLKENQKICITGGASTPIELILELAEKIKTFNS